MDEHVGGISTNYMTNGVLLKRGLELKAPVYHIID